MEELFLRSLLIRNELDVINQKNINLSETRSERIGGPLLNAKDELIGKGFTGDIRGRVASASAPSPHFRLRAERCVFPNPVPP